MLIDADMFLNQEFCVADFLDGYDIAGLKQLSKNYQIAYLWPALIFFRMNNLPNKHDMKFFPCIIDKQPVDTGGYLHYYFQANPQVRTLFFNQPGRVVLQGDKLIYSPSCGTFMGFERALCSECKKINNKSCTHVPKILKDLNFSEKIINYCGNGELPNEIELVLNGFFVHFKDASNQHGKPAQPIEEKLIKFYSLLDKVLA